MKLVMKVYKNDDLRVYTTHYDPRVRFEGSSKTKQFITDFRNVFEYTDWDYINFIAVANHKQVTDEMKDKSMQGFLIMLPDQYPDFNTALESLANTLYFKRLSEIGYVKYVKQEPKRKKVNVSHGSIIVELKYKTLRQVTQIQLDNGLKNYLYNDIKGNQHMCVAEKLYEHPTFRYLMETGFKFANSETVSFELNIWSFNQGVVVKDVIDNAENLPSPIYSTGDEVIISGVLSKRRAQLHALMAKIGKTLTDYHLN